MEKSEQNDSKYYTPSIEEFRVGFEYEERGSTITDKGWHKTVNVIWIKNTFCDSKNSQTNYLSLWYLNEAVKRALSIYDSPIRVKYLNSSDIQSLGFELDKDAVNPILANKGGYSILYNIDTHFLIVNSHKRLFEGTIKNISELKFILKAIGCE